MNAKYLSLFTEIAHATEIIAEQVMAYDREQNDEKGERTAQVMRDDYGHLYDKMNVSDFDSNILTKEDYQKLLVGALIVVNNINTKIENEQKAVNRYNIDIIPKLNRILNECETQEQINTLANEIFEINI